MRKVFCKYVNKIKMKCDRLERNQTNKVTNQRNTYFDRQPVKFLFFLVHIKRLIFSIETTALQYKHY